MATLIVPQDPEGQEWPTLGPLVCQWIEEYLVFGPGDLRGQPAVLDDEKRALVWRIYEVFPQGHPLEGRRRFKRVGISLPKGMAKTEFAAWIAAAELHPNAPVRCDGFDADGNPVGTGVTDPYIPLVAYTEEQSDELVYAALKSVLEEGPLAEDFDIGLERIMRRDGTGRAVSLSSSPSARDGARTTFQVADETHWWSLPRLKQAHQTMMQNLPKRKGADAWALEVTTAPEPGAGSVAEDTMDYARAVDAGKISDSRLFFFHRQASQEEHDLDTEEGARAAVIEASGPAAAWRDIDSVVELWRDPTTSRSYWRRVWLNQMVRSERKAFDVSRWRSLRRARNPVAPGDLITIGFDGAQTRDSTAIVCTHVDTGYQWLAGLWEQPVSREGWRVPAEEVDDVIRDLYDSYEVWRGYFDPPYWQSWIARWAGEIGEEQVVEWWTNRRTQMRAALESFHTAIGDGSICHSGDEDLARHIGNAHRRDLKQRDEHGEPLWLIQKERPDSPHKIDAAMAAVLSWEARNDAVAAGALQDGGAGVMVM